MRANILGLVVALAVQASATGAAIASSNGFPISTAYADQTNPQIVPDGQGGAIVVFVDTRTGDAEIYGQRIGPDGSALWGQDGVLVATLPASPYALACVSDGGGGAVFCWEDGRFGHYSIFAQRVLGTRASAWGPGGVQVSDPSYQGDDVLPSLAADGSGGAIVCWSHGDGNGYAQRILASGARGWAASGVQLGPSTNAHSITAATTDGSGGAILAFLISGNVYAQHVDSNGAILWGAGALALAPSATSQSAGGTVSGLALAPDGAGGATATWIDYRAGAGGDVYAQRVTGAGSLSWGQGGAAVCNDLNAQASPSMAPDGTGGYIFAWQDSRYGSWDIFGQRVDGAGTARWTANGEPLSIQGGDQTSPSTVADGSGGAFIAWQDSRNPPTGSDVYAQHVSSDGTALLADQGTPLTTAPSTQAQLSSCSDGNGGILAAWTDYRYSNWDIFGQRLNSAGQLTSVTYDTPQLVAVRDVPNDQGGRVKVDWRAPTSESGPQPSVSSYWVWRSIPPNQVAAAGRARAWFAGGPGIASPHAGDILAVRTATGDYFWEYLAEVPSAHLPLCSYVAPTTSDSLAGSNPFTAFMIEAVGSEGNFFSSPDSGYSVDNLTPPTPIPFAATYGAVSNQLHWTTNPALDFAEFRLYRGVSSDFAPSASNIVAATRDTNFTDAPGAFYYRLGALDVHGNVSSYAMVSPASPVATLASLVSADAFPDRIALTWYVAARGNPVSIYRRTLTTGWSTVGALLPDGVGFVRYVDTDVAQGTSYGYRLGIMDAGAEVFAGETWATAQAPKFALEGARPNPAVGGRLVIQFVLASDEPAKLELTDVAGRSVASEDVTLLGLGRHSVDLAAGMRVRPGIYMVRLTEGQASLSSRAVVLR